MSFRGLVLLGFALAAVDGFRVFRQRESPSTLAGEVGDAYSSEATFAVEAGDVGSSEVMLVVEVSDADSDQRSANEVLQLVNAERRKTGAPAVCLNDKLTRAAAVHTADMVRTGRLSHQGSDGSWPADRVTRQGYSWRAVGENIAAGQRDAQEVVRSWMNSPGHRRNILNPAYKNMGYASLPASDSWRRYHTQKFGTLQSGSGCSESPGPTPAPPSPMPTPPSPVPTPSGCVDKNPQMCPRWAARGYCSPSSPFYRWMIGECCRTCRGS